MHLLGNFLENTFVDFSHSDCLFAYRNSIFKESTQGRYLVCNVSFRLNKKPSPNISYAPLKKLAVQTKNVTPRDIYEWVCELRKEKLPDPKVLPNAGSFFKNPVISKERFLELKLHFPELVAYSVNDTYKIAAGWLIDNARLKGKTIGGVGIHKKQALVLVNYSESDGVKVWDLARMVMKKIKSIYDIDLEPEVRVLGMKD